MASASARIRPRISALERRLLFAAANLVNPSDPDPTFGTGGSITVDLGDDFPTVRDMIALPGGRTLVLTDKLLRLNADGSPDETFGPGGLRDLPAGDNPSQVGLAPDGDLFLVGSTREGAVQGADGVDDWFVRRINPDGTPDESFGTAGRVVLDIAMRQDIPACVLPLADGRVVVVGYEQRQFLSRVKQTPRTALARFNVDGSLDTTFGTNGIVVTALPGLEANRATAAAMQPDGKIVVVGTSLRREAGFEGEAGPAQVLVMRYNADGTLDTTFGRGDGVVMARGEGFGNDVALGADGTIVVAGQQLKRAAGGTLAVKRFRADGAADRTFGRAGTATFRLAPDDAGTISIGSGQHVAIQPDGHVVVSGVASTTQVAIVRFTPNGRPDINFGAGGAVLTEYVGGSVSTHVLTADDRTILATTPGVDLAFTRYKGFTVKPFASLSRGILRVAGTDGDDDTRVLNRPADPLMELVARQNGFEQTFASADVRRIIVNSGTGDDVVVVETSVAVPVQLLGGGGNDRLTGGEGNDRLMGGLGDDILFSRDGVEDVLGGGKGRDAAQLDELLDQRTGIESLLA